MEIKTAEQYVVSELIETKEKLAESQGEFEYLQWRCDDVVEKYDSLRSLIRKYLRLHTTTDNENYIFSDSVWEKFNVEDYNSFLSFFPELFHFKEGENTNGC